MGSIGKIIIALLAIGGTAAAYSGFKNSEPEVQKAEDTRSDEDKVEYIADVMRDMQTLPGSASDAQIDNWEQQMKKIVDPGNQKEMLCGLHATSAVMLAGLEMSASQMGSTEMAQDVQEDISRLVPGSMDDWLFRTAQTRVGTGGDNPFERAVRAVNHECMQQPFPHVLHHSINRNSQEMRDLEQCMANDSC